MKMGKHKIIGLRVLDSLVFLVILVFLCSCMEEEGLRDYQTTVHIKNNSSQVCFVGRKNESPNWAGDTLKVGASRSWIETYTDFRALNGKAELSIQIYDLNHYWVGSRIERISSDNMYFKWDGYTIGIGQ